MSILISRPLEESTTYKGGFMKSNIMTYENFYTANLEALTRNHKEDLGDGATESSLEEYIEEAYETYRYYIEKYGEDLEYIKSIGEK
jgi:hypothetical protein